MSDWVVLEGDCIERMREMDEASIDAIVCDPPYGLEFMGKEWDKLGASASHREDRADELGEENKRRYIASGVTYGQNVKQMQEWHQAWATEALRVLKPGGHLLAFGGTRTYHRLACAVEDAGFEIRDSLIWLYGSGFPKSLDVSKAIDKAAGAEREVVGVYESPDGTSGQSNHKERIGTSTRIGGLPEITAPSGHLPECALSEGGEFAEAVENAGNRAADERIPDSPLAECAPGCPVRWQGWGTALKPGHEPIVVARKPLIGTVAQNVTEHGTGALNIDGCRIGKAEGDRTEYGRDNELEHNGGVAMGDWEKVTPYEPHTAGRWSPNVALSHLPECGEPSQCPTCGSDDPMKQNRYGELWSNGSRYVVCPDPWHKGGCAPGCPIAELDEQSGERSSAGSYRDPVARTAVMDATGPANTPFTPGGQHPNQYANETGGASRFFYQAKASRGERNAGLDGFEDRDWADNSVPLVRANLNTSTGKQRQPQTSRNHHPTVKPIDLMRWLVRLVTPPGGTVLDPFTGSGTTGIAAVLEGFDFIGIEREAEYVEIARARLAFWEPHGGRDTEDVLVEAGFSERLEREHREAGQMGLLDG